MKIYNYCRHPRTKQELTANQDCPYTRRKRTKKYLPDAYWDQWIRPSRSWKDNRKTQYRPDGRGEQYSITFQPVQWGGTWKLEKYLKDKDIPFSVEKIYRQEWQPVYERVSVVRDGWTEDDFIWRKFVWKSRPTGEYHWVAVFDHDLLTWWSHKDIGIDYLLRRLEY